MPNQKPIECKFPIREVNRIAERKVMGGSDMSLYDQTNDDLVVRMSLETKRVPMPDPKPLERTFPIA